jgi:hypothetical protein
VALLGALAGYVAFCVLLLRHSPEARKRRREACGGVAAAAPAAAPATTPTSTAPAPAPVAAAGSSAPITPESQSPARRPPSAAGGDIPGLPSHQARPRPQRSLRHPRPGREHASGLFLCGACVLPARPVEGCRGPAAVRSSVSARGAQARPPLDGPVVGGVPAAPAPRAYPGAGAGAEAERLLVASVVADGRHHAHWPDGSEYFGEWRGGRAHGRGAFVWPSGAPRPAARRCVPAGARGARQYLPGGTCVDQEPHAEPPGPAAAHRPPHGAVRGRRCRQGPGVPRLSGRARAAGDRYEGEWREGREDGMGTAIGADGSRFYGAWQAGKLHGKGVRAARSQAKQQCAPPARGSAERAARARRCTSRRRRRTGARR